MQVTVRGAAASALVLWFGLAGCSDSTPSTSSGETGVIDTDSDLGTGGGDVDGPEVLGGPDTGVDVPLACGTFREPCGEADDCCSGWCVGSPEGLVCTSTCSNSCPEGWRCAEVLSAGGDPFYICVSLTATLCHPCSDHADCSETGGTANKCLPQGDEGQFCGIDCSDQGTTCPDGYNCDTVNVDGDDVEQCVPAPEVNGGLCECNGWAQQLHLATACGVSNAVGSCPGVRTCDGAGLGQCLGDAAVEETCNGRDDDCDGDTDEGLAGVPCEVTNAHGACPGTTVCGGASPQCQGPEPQAEVCNGFDDDCDGLTDEGFPNADGDAEADCLDDDDDGDGSPDVVDCKPLDPTVAPGLLEVCDLKDNNCDNIIDNPGATGCEPYWQDVDGDTFGSDAAGSQCLCAANPTIFYTADFGGDCNDLVPTSYPMAAEKCNGADDDCDGTTDEDTDEAPCATTNQHGTCTGVASCVSGVIACDGPIPEGETCNGFDDDCDGTTDEGFFDSDNDGKADCVDEDDDGDGAPDNLDCKPLNAAIYPGQQEACNAIDDDCDGATDEQGAVGCELYYQDADQDLVGADAVEPRCLCQAEPLIYFTADGPGDCNDVNPDAYPGQTETCNLIDDNCDGATDEGVASPCGSCGSLCVLEAGVGKVEGFGDDPAARAALTLGGDGSLALDPAVLVTQSLWAANAGDNSLSRVESSTGDEAARYDVCNNPSRVAVDAAGNAYVGCGGDGQVVKIAGTLDHCVDSNGNGTIQTSWDTNADGAISPTEKHPADECVLWTTDTGDANLSGLAIDDDGVVWAALGAAKALRRLSASTGAPGGSALLAGTPVNLAAAPGGAMWAATRQPAGIARVTPGVGAGPDTVLEVPAPIADADGIVVDGFGKVWLAGGSTGNVAWYDPGSGMWGQTGDLGRGHARGVAVSWERDGAGIVNGGKVFVGHHTTGNCTTNGTHRMVSVMDAASGAVTDPFDLGLDVGPVGLSLTTQGGLWSINQCSSNPTLVDLASGNVALVGTTPAATLPLGYGDATGYDIRQRVGSVGTYRWVQQGWPQSDTLWDTLIVQASLPPGTAMWVRYRVADSLAVMPNAAWQGPVGPYPAESWPLDLAVTGDVIEIELSLETTNLAVLPKIKVLTVIAREQN